eukprot:6189672-Pleurochrysis_carterae.AAC.2
MKEAILSLEASEESTPDAFPPRAHEPFPRFPGAGARRSRHLAGTAPHPPLRGCQATTTDSGANFVARASAQPRAHPHPIPPARCVLREQARLTQAQPIAQRPHNHTPAHCTRQSTQKLFSSAQCQHALPFF